MANYNILINKSNGDNTYDALYPSTLASLVPLSEQTKAKFPASANIQTVGDALKFLSKAVCGMDIQTISGKKNLVCYSLDRVELKRFNIED